MIRPLWIDIDRGKHEPNGPAISMVVNEGRLAMNPKLSSDPATRKYVIERSSECLREWWTERGWSKSDADARWYDHEPDAPAITNDEAAHPVFYPSGKVEAG